MDNLTNSTNIITEETKDNSVIDNLEYKTYTYHYKNKYGNMIKHTKKYIPIKKVTRSQLKRKLSEIPDDKLAEVYNLLDKY